MMPVPSQPDRTPVLICIGGLPATGKTTIAQALCDQLRAAYIRIDTIETAIDIAEGRFRQTNDWDAPPGYDVATDQLRNGLDVVAESVNPLRLTRDSWRDAGSRVDARVVEVEIICSDVDEHRRRAEERIVDIDGLTKPTWEQILSREYEPWHRDHLQVDTAILAVADAVGQIRSAIDA